MKAESRKILQSQKIIKLWVISKDGLSLNVVEKINKYNGSERCLRKRSLPREYRLTYSQGKHLKDKVCHGIIVDSSDPFETTCKCCLLITFKMWKYYLISK